MDTQGRDKAGQPVPARGDGSMPDGDGSCATVYFDGACPLCSREIATYRRMDGADRLRWVDITKVPAQELGGDLTREQALARFHVRDEQGRLVSGAAGFVVSNLLSSAPTIGASGSIFGLLAALIVYGRRRRISMLTAQLWQWAVIMLVMGFVMSGVNNLAHIGGFAGGWAAAALMRFEDEKRETPLVQVLALALLALTAFAVVMSFVRVTGLMLAAAR